MPIGLAILITIGAPSPQRLCSRPRLLRAAEHPPGSASGYWKAYGSILEDQIDYNKQVGSNTTRRTELTVGCGFC